MNRYLLICDMDGTLVDSMPTLTRLAIAIMYSAGIPRAWAEKHYGETVGKPFRVQLSEWNDRNRLVSEGRMIDVDKLSDLYSEVHASVAPMFGLTDFGQRLVAHNQENLPNLRMALVSSTHAKIIRSMPIARMAPWDYVGGFQEPAWTKRIQVEEAIQEAGVAKSHVFYVGDSESDLALAKSMGIRFLEPMSRTLTEVIGACIFSVAEG